MSRLCAIFVLTKLLTVTEYGQYAFLFSLIMFFTTIGHFGIGYANIYYSAKKNINDNIILGNSLFFCTIVGFFICLIVNILPYILKDMFSDIPSNILFITSTVVSASICLRYLMGLFNGKENYYQYAFLFTSTWVFQLFIILLLSLFVKINLLYTMIAFVLSRFLTIFLSIILFVEYQKLQFDFKELKNQIKYGIPVYSRDLADAFNFRYIFIILKNFYESSAIGNYALAIQASEVLLYIPRTLSTVLLPYFTSNNKNKKNINKILYIFIPTILIIVFLYYLIYPYLINYLFGLKYSDSINIFNYMLIGVFSLSVMSVFEAYTLSKNKQKILTKSSMLTALSLILLSYFLMPFKTLETAALFNSIILIFYLMLVLYFFYKKVMKDHFEDK